MARRTPEGGSLEVYLLPSVVGGGLGDLAEVHSAGRWLSSAGFPVRIFRRPGHPETAQGLGPFDWPPITPRPLRRSTRALTVAAQFGVTCAPGRNEPLGRPGEWAGEVAALEDAYGRAQVLHLSLEEFARTLTSRQQVEEREREGGVPSRLRRVRRPRSAQIRQAHELYRKFRAFDRSNLLPLFPTFAPVRAFAREFPEAVQIGPIRPFGVPPRRRGSRPGRRVVWYASPSTSDRLIDGIRAALVDAGPGARLTVRAPRPLALRPAPGLHIDARAEMPEAAWRRAWAAADLAIVTGSRTLLEAVAAGVPFLYFNGVAGRGRKVRRHRPEKLLSFLRLGPRGGIGPAWRRDLLDFSRARRVREAVRDQLAHTPGAQSVAWSRGFPRGRSEGQQVLVELARRFARGQDRSAPELVRAWRTTDGGHRAARSKD